MANSEKSDTADVRTRNWNTGGLFWGSLVILIGVLMFLDNLGVYDFNLSRIWRLWPIIIIAIGVSLLSLRGWVAKLVNTLLMLGMLASVVYVTIAPVNEDSPSAQQAMSIDATNENLDTPGEVNVVTGAASLNFSSSGSVDLVDATLDSDSYALNYNDEVVGNRHRVTIEPERSADGWSFMPFGVRNQLDVKLSESRLLDLAIDAGAASVDADLSNVMLRSLDIDTGAASVDIKLGDKVRHLRVLIDVGASSVDLKVPKSSGVRVEASGGLSSREFQGMSEVDEDIYESKGFNEAENQIIIVADMGASSFKIARY